MTACRTEPSWQQEYVVNNIVADDPLAGDISLLHRFICFLVPMNINFIHICYYLCSDI